MKKNLFYCGILFVLISAFNSCSTLSVQNEESNNISSVDDIESNEILAGDIILNDGSFVKYELLTEEQKNRAIAVVINVNADGKVLGLGLNEGKHLSWAKAESTGYNTNFSEIGSAPSSKGLGAADTAVFSGDINGSDNWDVISITDEQGALNAAVNYPLFDWANNYGVNNQLPTEYSTGWYVPSIYELTEIYRNRIVIDEALTAVGGKILGNEYFWSSSQNPSSEKGAWCLFFRDKAIDSNFKGNLWKVRCIRAF